MVEFVEPATLRDAAALARERHADGRLLSGGTAVVLLLRQRLINPEVLISLRGLSDVPDWRDISLSDGWLRIGAGASLSQVAGSELVRRAAPSLAYAASVVGNVRIRNAATLGGNVGEADYASDPPAVLVDLGAEIEVTSDTGVRTVPAAEMFVDFFTTALAPGEIVTAVRLPTPSAGARALYQKYRSGSAEDRPCVGVAASLRLAEPDRSGAAAVASLSVVIGAVSGAPQRWPEITEQAVGRRLDHRLIDRLAAQHADAVDPIDDARGSAWYRREMVRALVRRGIAALAEGPGSD